MRRIKLRWKKDKATLEEEISNEKDKTTLEVFTSRGKYRSVCRAPYSPSLLLNYWYGSQSLPEIISLSVLSI